MQLLEGLSSKSFVQVFQSCFLNESSYKQICKKRLKMLNSLKIIFFFGLISIFFNYSESGTTVEQMITATRMMRDSCQNKLKISDEIADGIKHGKMPDEKPVKCYINCILEMTQLMKKGKIQEESVKKQFDIMLPDELKDEYKNALEQCKNSVIGIKNPCDASFAMLKCFYNAAPNFIFP